jgi:hypothetical protein
MELPIRPFKVFIHTSQVLAVLKDLNIYSFRSMLLRFGLLNFLCKSLTRKPYPNDQFETKSHICQ